MRVSLLAKLVKYNGVDAIALYFHGLIDKKVEEKRDCCCEEPNDKGERESMR